LSTNDDLACKEFVELVTDYLEGALPEPLRAAFEAHLDVCSGCDLYLGQMRLSIRALRAPRGGMIRPQTRDRLLQQFRQWRRAASG
jgi:hypothetical protein